MKKPILKNWWVPALLATLAFGIYVRTLGADFLRWDDRQNILLNPWIENATFSLIWTRSYYNMYIPVTYTFWTLLWHISKSPWIFHLSNLLLHAANTVLVYHLARRLFKEKDNWWPAFVAAAVFCSHPLQVETVAWISTGRDLLASFFSLLAANMVMAARTTVPGLWLSTLLFCVSLLCKPSVAVLPAGLLLLAYACDLWTRPRTTALWLWFIPGFAATIVTKRIQQLDADLRLPPMDIGRRMLVALDSFGFYVQKLLAPYPLAADYGRTREVALNEPLWAITLAGLLVVAIALYIFRRRLSKPALGFVALFGLLLSPVLGLIPFQAQFQSTVSDRYAYLPLMAVGLMCGFAIKKKAWPALAVLIAVWGSMTAARAETWMTNELFFTDMLAKNEKSHVALSSLGVEYILTNRLAEAEVVLKRAIQLKPMDVIPRTNLAQLYLLFNRADLVVSEIAPLLDDKEFLRINQTETRALASAYRLTGRAHHQFGLWSKANDFYCRWFQLDYENEEGRAEMGKFMEDSRNHQVSLPNCEIRTAN